MGNDFMTEKEQEKLLDCDELESAGSSRNSFMMSPLLPTTSLAKPVRPIYLQENFEISGRLKALVWNGSSHLSSSAVASWALLLVPSFLRHTRKTVIHPTSWLDGLRGVASFIVFIHHFILFWYTDLNYAYGTPDQKSWNFFQFPFMRVLYGGRGMVCIFFVVSGYALSYSPLRKMRNRDYEPLLHSLASSLFRRGLRLFIPVLACTFVSLLINRQGFAITSMAGPGPQGTFFEQLKDWWWQFVLISNPVQTTDPNTVYSHPYAFQLWTIPREYRGSLCIYLMALCLATTTGTIRLVLIVFSAHYLLWISNWDLYLFSMGMLFADLQLKFNDIAQSPRLPRLLNFVPSAIRRRSDAIIFTLSAFVTLLSVHFLTLPDMSAETAPGYATMIAWTPKGYDGTNLTQRFWLCMGSVMIVGVFCFCPPLFRNSKTPFYQIPFNTPFAQYLADISYALYCVHPHIVFTFGDKILQSYAGETGMSYLSGFLMAAVVNFTLTFWWADLFWRAVDMKSVTIGKWVAKMCFIKL
ncbi:uncharacterized protein RSE6_09957 [Rhynchosporium secalis]|uniref:Acyltransferase 3 domain-containing protein n=1 Tax=Rhynchosporium secalis TaxID=38038 RepID=A0A1E1MJ72_RHYSE|nr:uncharacterized protein RSE6_09957 [Rhynchosporium secalis]